MQVDIRLIPRVESAWFQLIVKYTPFKPLVSNINLHPCTGVPAKEYASAADLFAQKGAQTADTEIFVIPAVRQCRLNTSG